MKILSRRRSGEPGIVYPKRSWAPQLKPMRPIRSIRTLIARDEANGRTMPEFKNLLQRAGVGSRQSAKVVMRQEPESPPSFGTRPGKTVTKAKTGPLRRR